MRKKTLLLLTIFLISGIKLAQLKGSISTDITIFAQEEDTHFTTTNKSNYDVKDYKNYNNRKFDQEEFKDKFYYTPLIKVPKEYGSFSASEKGSDPEKVYKEIREELALTGYEAYCMVKDVPIEPNYSNRLIERFLELYPDGVNKLTTTKDTLNTDNSKYPIWRDVSGKQFLMTSLEEYLGFKDLYENDPALTELNTAPINSLLSQEQACVQGWRSIAAQNRACNRLENRSECALTKRRVPGSGYEIHDVIHLLGDFDNKFSIQDDQKTTERAIKGCQYLFSTPENKLTDDEKNLKKVIINVPTYMDRSYRLGFLITVIETKIPKTDCNAPVDADIIFNFFTQTTKCKPKDEVLVSAFKLPDIGTNKGPLSTYGHEEWDDPLDLTRLSLTTKEQQEVHEGGRHDKRSSIFAGAKNAGNNVTQDSEIYCYTHENGKLDATNTCLAPVPRALVDIVNGTVSKKICGNKAEAVKILNDIAGTRVKNPMDTYGKEFNVGNGGVVLQNIFFGSLYNSNGLTPGQSQLDLTTIWEINEDTWNPKISKTVAHFYLVYPMGYELKDIEKAIKGTFFSKEQLANMEQDSNVTQSFEMTGQTQALNNKGIHWSYEDIDETKAHACGDYVDEKTGAVYPIPCIKHPNIKIVGGDGQVNILGAKLGWWLRKVQNTLNSKKSLAYNYFESCKTMEEFLLGKCSGVVNSNAKGDGKLDENAKNICEVAEIYNIDCKFLRSIYAIETGSGTYMPHSDTLPGTNNYCCNSIGYCGPMSVSSYHATNISAGDDLKVCKPEELGMDAFILASRWILIKKWCTSNPNECLPDPEYDHWKNKYIEQEGNSHITTKKEVESFVRGWYGSLEPVPERIGWPSGATYQDAVMACMGLLSKETTDKPAIEGGWGDWIHPPKGVGGGARCPVND